MIAIEQFNQQSRARRWMPLNEPMSGLLLSLGQIAQISRIGWRLKVRSVSGRRESAAVNEARAWRQVMIERLRLVRSMSAWQHQSGPKDAHESFESMSLIRFDPPEYVAGFNAKLRRQLNGSLQAV